MTASSSFLIIHKPCDQAVIWATFKLEQSGYQVIRTFDLQTARLTHPDYPCPRHGSIQCDCQMVVLLVYQAAIPPLTMAIHGTNKTSWFHFTNIQHQPAGLQLEKNLQALLGIEIFEEA
jgi:hypothetical protein